MRICGALLHAPSRNVRKLSFLKAFAIYPHRLWINLCMAPRQNCAMPLLRGPNLGW